MVCPDLNIICFPSTDGATKVSMDGDYSLLRTAWEEKAINTKTYLVMARKVGGVNVRVYDQRNS